MDKDYKLLLKGKKKEAQRIMTSEQMKACHGAIHTAAIASFGGGVIPFPVADAIPITAAQLAMVAKLGSIFGTKVSETAAKALIGTAAATMVGRSVAKVIPIVGWGISGAVAAGVTEAIGWSIAVDFAKQTKNSSTVSDSNYEVTESPSDEDNTKQTLEARAKPFLSGEKTKHSDKSEYEILINDFEKVLDQIPEHDPLRSIYDRLCLLF